MASPARLVLRRRIEWVDTDGAGIYHWTTVFRLFEAAEAALHHRLGLVERTFGHMPRVHVEVDFRAELAFYDLVDFDLRVARLGTSSVRYEFELRRGDTVAAAGHVVTVHVSEQPGGRPAALPDDLRAGLGGGGDLGVDGHASASGEG